MATKKKSSSKRKVARKKKAAPKKKLVTKKKKLVTKKKAPPKTKATAKKKAAKKKAAPKALVAATAAATGPADVIDIPPRDTFNKDLSSASEATMIALLGIPGAKTKSCSDPTGAFKNRIKFGVNVGPFKVSGLDIAVASLKAVFDDAKAAIPGVVAAVKTEGMLCVRHKRANPDSFSNHSWGAAIDLKFGPQVIDQGVHRTHRGILQLVPFFNKHGWFWGGGFSGGSVDSMHFELAEQTIRAS